MKTVKVTPASSRDFKFFLNTDLDMIGNQVGVKTEDDPDGYSAVECWHLKDSNGVSAPCREQAKLNKAFRGKKSWNLQVKMWAEDLSGDMPVLRQGELFEMCVGMPPWIFQATIQQASRKIDSRIGWVPRFARYETLFDSWWAPGMDAFDAAI